MDQTVSVMTRVAYPTLRDLNLEQLAELEAFTSAPPPPQDLDVTKLSFYEEAKPLFTQRDKTEMHESTREAVVLMIPRRRAEILADTLTIPEAAALWLAVNFGNGDLRRINGGDKITVMLGEDGQLLAKYKSFALHYFQQRTEG